MTTQTRPTTKEELLAKKKQFLMPCYFTFYCDPLWIDRASMQYAFDEDGRKLRDVENPDPALRNRTVIGLDLISNLRATPGEPSQWTGGEIYDPASGNTYRATLEVVSPDCVNVRGYVGIQWLGRTTTWIRVGAKNECGGKR